MPYTPKGYTDRDAVEAFLQETLPQSNDEVNEAIAAAEEIIDSETGRDFTAYGAGALEDRLYDGDGTDTLLIGSGKDITEVKLDPDSDPLDDDQYVLYPANETYKTKIKLRYLVFPVGLQNIVVNAKWGGPQVKADIRLAATMLAAGILQNGIPETTDIQSMTVGRYTVSYKTSGPQAGALAKVEDILQLNKRYHF